MFRQNIPSINHQDTPSDLPLWADGFFYWVKQAELIFGSDRKSPIDSRPVLSIKKHSTRFIVLPSTSKKNTTFYHLSADTVSWNTCHINPDSYLTYRYETLFIDSNHKAGTINHAERINVIHWLKDRN